jgi:hypothetical protein
VIAAAQWHCLKIKDCVSCGVHAGWSEVAVDAEEAVLGGSAELVADSAPLLWQGAVDELHSIENKAHKIAIV